MVARFGLFLREMAAAREHAPPPAATVSQLTGIVLIGLGVAVNLLAVKAFRDANRRLGRGELPEAGTWTGAALGLVLAAVGVVIAVHLLTAST